MVRIPTVKQDSRISYDFHRERNFMIVGAQQTADAVIRGKDHRATRVGVYSVPYVACFMSLTVYDVIATILHLPVVLSTVYPALMLSIFTTFISVYQFHH